MKAAYIVVAGVLLSSTAAAEKGSDFIGDWWSVDYDTADRSCMVTDITDYELFWYDGSLSVRVLDGQLAPLALGNDYLAELRIDDRSFKIKVRVDLDTKTTTYFEWSEPSAPFLVAFRTGKLLSGTVGGVKLEEHPLTETDIAMTAMEQCQSKMTQ